MLRNRRADQNPFPDNSAAEAEWNVLVIEESCVLFRVKHLEEGAGRIPVDPATNLVDFIDQDKRILCTHALERLDDLAWQGAEEESA